MLRFFHASVVTFFSTSLAVLPAFSPTGIAVSAPKMKSTWVLTSFLPPSFPKLRLPSFLGIFTDALRLPRLSRFTYALVGLE